MPSPTPVRLNETNRSAARCTCPSACGPGRGRCGRCHRAQGAGAFIRTVASTSSRRAMSSLEVQCHQQRRFERAIRADVALSPELANRHESPFPSNGRNVRRDPSGPAAPAFIVADFDDLIDGSNQDPYFRSGSKIQSASRLTSLVFCRCRPHTPNEQVAILGFVCGAARHARLHRYCRRRGEVRELSPTSISSRTMTGVRQSAIAHDVAMEIVTSPPPQDCPAMSTGTTCQACRDPEWP